MFDRARETAQRSKDPLSLCFTQKKQKKGPKTLSTWPERSGADWCLNLDGAQQLLFEGEVPEKALGMIF